MRRLILALVCGAGAAVGVADPDARPYDGGDWAKDRLARGLVPNPTYKDFARARTRTTGRRRARSGR